MAVTFLIGGTGNQLFIYAAAPENDKMSMLFLHPVIRRAFGWTQHEQVFRFEYPNIFQHSLAILALAIDLPLAKFCGRSLFTEFDTRHIKKSAHVLPFVRLGYFQTASEQRSVEPLARQIAPVTEEGLIALHIRGGDLLALELAGNNVYGLPDSAYYRAGITAVRDALNTKNRKPNRLLVLTDDPVYAKSIDLSVDGVPAAEILNLPLEDTFAQAVGAEWYISSNSTLSYWIVRLRDGTRSLAPQPFQKRHDFDLPASTQRLAVKYT